MNRVQETRLSIFNEFYNRYEGGIRMEGWMKTLIYLATPGTKSSRVSLEKYITSW